MISTLKRKYVQLLTLSTTSTIHSPSATSSLTSANLQALAVISIGNLASTASRTSSAASPSNTSTLRVLWESSATRWWAGWWRGRLGPYWCGWAGSTSSRLQSRDLGVDESQCCLAVLDTIALVRRGVAAVTTVRVSGVAVRLDLGG